MAHHRRYPRIVTPPPALPEWPDLGHWYDDDDDYERDEYEDALQECGQVREGGCLMAGTEHCDFECPFRDVDLFADDEEG
jgi:hypothetical protein